MRVARSVVLMLRNELEEELAFFEEHRPEWSERYDGLFVLIEGRKLLGVFPTAEAAYAAGLRTVGLKPFLVKQVRRQEPVAFVPVLLSSQGRDG